MVKSLGHIVTWEKETLEQTVANAIAATSVHHFCGSGAGVQFQTHVLGVYDQAGCLQGYVCAVHAEESCSPVFNGDPKSWMVMGDKIERLSIRKWIELMTAADPGKICIYVSTNLISAWGCKC